jgi:peptide-methionine (R)-S-oxide reductase
MDMEKPAHHETDMKKKLTPEQYNICFLKGTEPAGSGKYLHNKAQGTYFCVACGQELFSSDSKFDSGTGWPSFFKPSSKGAVTEQADNAYGMKRVEINCGRCGAHLGHVFDDGPEPTGQRFCVNSLSLKFEEKK